ncbi:MAG: glycosyltransferase [Elusimicrobia bacterium]|nr:glycosyltransferase [Elusimicrobiota bacterium]
MAENRLDGLNVGAVDLASVAASLLERGASVRLEARGSSMSPIIKDGDTLEVRPAGPAGLRRGDIVLYSKDDRMAAHRIVGASAGQGGWTFTLKADSGDGLDQVTESEILGRVAARIRKGDRTPLDKPMDRVLGLLVSAIPHPLHRLAFRLGRTLRGIPVAAPRVQAGPALKLTVSIVNWNVRDYLDKCLASVFRHAGGLDLEVIVVDNASSDGSAAMVREKYPEVRVVENRENVGYGSGHNQAVALARGEFVLFLNPDTEMLPDTLARSVRFMEEHPEAGAAMPREIERPEDKDEAWEVGVVLTGWRRVLWDLCLRANKAFPNSWCENRILDTIARWRGRFKDGFFFAKVDYLEGGFLLARRSALAEAGEFDRRYFLGHEGIDLTQRVKRLGWKLYALINVWVIHYGSKSSDLLGEEGVDRLERRWRDRVVRERGPGSAGGLAAAAKRLLKLPLHLRDIQAADLTWDPGRLADLAFDGLEGLLQPAQVRSEIIRLVELLKARQPEVIVEIGTELGGTLFLFSRAAAKDALLVSVDLPGPFFGGGEGYSAARIPLYRSIGLKGQTIRLVRSDSGSDRTLARVRELLGGRKADFLFIDGDHAYDAVRSDFERYSPLVREGGIIAFHDIVPDPSTGDQESPRLWREIKAAHPVEEIVEDWDQKGFGIGVIPDWRPPEKELRAPC